MCEWEGRRPNLLLLIPTNEHNLEARLGYPLTFVGWAAVGRSEGAREEGNALPSSYPGGLRRAAVPAPSQALSLLSTRNRKLKSSFVFSSNLTLLHVAQHPSVLWTGEQCC